MWVCPSGMRVRGLTADSVADQIHVPVSLHMHTGQMAQPFALRFVLSSRSLATLVISCQKCREQLLYSDGAYL